MLTTKIDQYLTVNSAGHLQIEDVDCVDIVEKWGSPLYVISENTLRWNYQRLYNAVKASYPKFLICFASKANNGLAVRRILQLEGSGFECHGLGELYPLLLLGADVSKIIVDGSNKSYEELEACLRAGVNIVVESQDELEAVDVLAGQLRRVPRVILRLNPSCMSPDNKNGMDFDTGYKACMKALELKNVNFVGVAEHAGSQIPLEVFRNIAVEMMDFAARVKKGLKWDLEYVGLGAGFAAGRKGLTDFSYRSAEMEEEIPTIEEYAETLTATVKHKIEEHSLCEPTLIFEPGRYLAGSAGVILCRVGNIKKVQSNTTKVFVDANFNMLMRTATSGFRYHVIAANKADLETTEVVDIVGSTSFGGPVDTLAKDKPLPRLVRDDIIAILDTGAYCESTTTQYNSYPRPASVLVRGSDVEIIRERETYQDIVGRDRVPPWLSLTQP